MRYYCLHFVTGHMAVNCVKSTIIQFSLDVFTEFDECSDKNSNHYIKRARTCHSAAPCVRDQDATTVPARHVLETGSLNWLQFMFE